MIADAVALDQRDEIARRVARERRAAEVGIAAKGKFAGPAWMLVKLQRPPPEMRIFSPSVAVVLDQQDAAAALSGQRRAHHAGGAGADDDDVEIERRSQRFIGAVRLHDARCFVPLPRAPTGRPKAPATFNR